MIEISKGKTPKAANQNEPDPTAVNVALPAVNNLQALAKAFAPVVEMRATEDLKVNRRNARSHSERQVQQIASSVNEFGWLAPIVVDEEGIVLAGHGRLRAAQLLQMEMVPTIQVKHLTGDIRSAKFVLAHADKHVPDHLSLEDLMEGRSVIEFTAEDVARFDKARLVEGMQTLNKEQAVELDAPPKGEPFKQPIL